MRERTATAQARGHALSTEQQSIIDSNFERTGPFYLNRDMHPMLDCACNPDVAISAESRGVMGRLLDEPVGIQFNAKLREEFFGGILFDCDRHRHYMVDQEGFEVLSRVTESRSTGRELLQSGVTENALASLLTNEVLGPLDGKKTVKHFAARNLALEYLQSPSIVEIEVTYGCFRACRHCAYESSPDARTPNELTADRWRDVFIKLASAGVLIVQLTGGDPLFRDDSFDIVEAAGDAGLSVYVRSDTAALSASNLARLKSVRGLWHVGTSIDGADAEMHDWMRGRGAFELLRERIGALAAEGVSVAAGATLHKNNFHTVRDIGRRVTEFGATWFDIGFLAPVGRGENLRDLVLAEHEIAESLNSYIEGVRAGEYLPSHAHYIRRAQSETPFKDVASLVGRMPYLTEWPFSRLRLDPTGSAYTAGKLKGSDYAAGFNLLESPVDYVWDHSPNLQALRNVGASGRIHSLDYRTLTSSHLFNIG